MTKITQKRLLFHKNPIGAQKITKTEDFIGFPTKHKSERTKAPRQMAIQRESHHIIAYCLLSEFGISLRLECLDI
jgi:hypothetical protein